MTTFPAAEAEGREIPAHSEAPLDEAALRNLLDAASAMRRSDDEDHILAILVSSVRIVAPKAGVWVARKHTSRDWPESQDPALAWSGHGAVMQIDVSKLPSSWPPRLGEGQPPFAADVAETPLATIDPAARPQALSVFPMSSPSGVAALMVGLPITNLPTSVRSVIGLLCQEASLALDLGTVNAAALHTEALFETLAKLSASYSDADGVLDTIVHRTTELLGMDASWVMLADEQKQRLHLTTVFGITGKSFDGMSISVHDLLPGAAIRKRRAVCLRDAQGDEQSKYSRPEGLRTVMCAPMFVEDELVGVLVAAHREVRDASAEDRRIMEALASAAALSIANARLYAEREEVSLQLQRTQEFQKSLTALMLTGASLDEIVTLIAGTLEREVVVLDPDLAILHRSSSDGDEAQDLTMLVHAIEASEEALTGTEITSLVLDDEQTEIAVAPLDLAGERTAYVVVVVGEHGLEGAELGMSEASVTAIGLELMRDRASAEAEARLAGGLFRTLLADGEGNEATIRRRASYMGYELSGSNTVIAVTLPKAGDDDDVQLLELRTSIQRAARRHRNPPTAVFEYEDAVYVLLNETADSGELAEEHSKLIANELKASERHSSALIAHAGPHTGIGGVRQAVDEASHALHVLAVTDRAIDPVAFGDLGIWTLLGSMGDHDRLASFAEGVLGELIAYDEERQSQLVETVRALVASNFQIRSAAERLYVHPNTLRHRIQRIAELSGLNFSEPDDRLKADIALRVIDVERGG